MNTQS